ncbi:MAG: hypothetical protein ABR861_10895, partial [Terriglobales bacterium]
TAAPLPPRGCGGPLYLLSCIKPLDAFTSGTERLQSKLVQTFLRQKWAVLGVVVMKDVTSFEP